VALDDVLVDLKLAPDELEVPVPRYFTEDRSKAGGRSNHGQTAVERGPSAGGPGRGGGAL
jgi:hypothetical protein